MKKAIRFIVVAAALISALQSLGGTARVFVQNLGGNLKTPNDVQQEHYVQFLSGYNIDFGVFYGPTSASNFGLTADGYSATVEYNSGTSLLYAASTSITDRKWLSNKKTTKR